MMTPATEKRFVAFVQTFAGRCASCVRRNESNCRRCASTWANTLMREYEHDAKTVDDISLAGRMQSVVEQLRTAARPLLASQIHMRQVSPQLKRWTLMQMQALGILRRKPAFRGRSRGRSKIFYAYYLPNNKGNNNNE